MDDDSDRSSAGDPANAEEDADGELTGVDYAAALSASAAIELNDPALDYVNRSLKAMELLAAEERQTSIRTISFAVWYPELGFSIARRPRGALLQTMGAALSNYPWLLSHPLLKGCVHSDYLLNPEETLYLVERGSLAVRTRAVDRMVKDLAERRAATDAPRTAKDGEETSLVESDTRKSEVAPESLVGLMSLQQAYSCMLGPGLCSLEEFQLYGYLRRLGFVVIRPDFRRPQPPYHPPSRTRPLSPFATIATSLFRNAFAAARPLFSAVRSFLAPVARILLPFLFAAKPLALPQTPFRHHFDVYRPSSRFKKTGNQVPDIALIVVRPDEQLPRLDVLAACIDSISPPSTATSSSAENSTETRSASSGTQVKVAVVEQGQVSFLALSRRMLDPRIKSKAGKKGKKKRPGAFQASK
ncbi:hypothetical protein DFJ73DRAFT_759454 [Zopfochytrium polystomum]|nr:hypothetical protein DFJ73DRAFT_759454 [Zopfochytrium polystomum]